MCSNQVQQPAQQTFYRLHPCPRGAALRHIVSSISLLVRFLDACLLVVRFLSPSRRIIFTNNSILASREPAHLRVVRTAYRSEGQPEYVINGQGGELPEFD